MTSGRTKERWQAFLGLYMVLARSLGLYVTSSRTVGKVGVCTAYAELLDTVLGKPGWALRWYEKARRAHAADPRSNPASAWYFELPELRTLYRMDRHEYVVNRGPRCLAHVRDAFTRPDVAESEAVNTIASSHLNLGDAAAAKKLLVDSLDRIRTLPPVHLVRTLINLADAERELGAHPAALEHLDEADTVVSAHGITDPYLSIRKDASRAAVTVNAGDFERGARLLGAAVDRSRAELGTTHALTAHLEEQQRKLRSP